MAIHMMSYDSRKREKKCDVRLEACVRALFSGGAEAREPSVTREERRHRRWHDRHGMAGVRQESANCN